MKEDETRIQSAIENECSNLNSMLILKNKMYGNSFFKTLDEYGKVLICVRLEDKLNRLKQIILKGEKDENTDEKLIDTLMDLGGYAILSKVYLSQSSKGNYKR